MKKFSVKWTMVQSFLRISCMALLGGVLMFAFGLKPVKADNLLKISHDVEKHEGGGGKYGVVKMKNGDMKIIARDLDGAIVKMKVRYDDYDEYDSVFVIRKKNDCWYCFSQKTGIISKPYFNMGFPGVNSTEKRLIACVSENKKLGFLNCHTGELEIPCKFYYDDDIYDEYYRFLRNSPYFYGNTCLHQMYNDKGGVWDCVIDIDGKILLGGYPAIWETDYFEGYIVRDAAGNESLYTKDFKCVMSGKEDIEDYKVGILYSDSLGAIPMLTNHKLTKTVPVYTLIDVGVCESLTRESGDDEREFKTEAEYYTFDIDYRLGAGVIDRDMNLVIDPTWNWDRVVPIGNGYFVCYSSETGFLMDKNGNFVVPKARNTFPTNR